MCCLSQSIACRPHQSQIVAQTVLMGLGENASFEFHVGNWLGRERDGIPIGPEARQLNAATALCIYRAARMIRSVPNCLQPACMLSHCPAGIISMVPTTSLRP